MKRRCSCVVRSSEEKGNVGWPADHRPASRTHGARKAGEVEEGVFIHTWSSPPSGSQLGAQKAALTGRGSEVGAGPRWARRPFGPRPFPPPDDATAPAPQRLRESLRTRAPAPVAAPGSAAPKVAERAGGGTSLKGLRERMGERAGGSRRFSGPCGTRDSRGFGDRRSGRTLFRSRLACRRVLLSPPSERPGTGRVAERGRGREGRPAQVLQPAVQLPLPTAAPPPAGGAREN